MTAAKNAPLVMEVGELYRYRTTVLDPAGTVIPDLAAYRAYIRFGGAVQNGVMGPALVEYTTENGGVTRDGNLFRWVVSPADTRRLRTGVWQMVVISPANHPSRIYEGPVTLKPEIKAPRVE